MHITIDGKNLTIAQVVSVARSGAQVRLSEEAAEAVRKARDYVDDKLRQGAVIYGLTTGFGKFSDTFIPTEDAAALQRNLILSHACAMGEPYPTEVVRAAMLLRCNALARGHSGICPGTLETLVKMLNQGVHPVIPQKGSLGSSGDLAPLSHMVLPMLGEGKAEYQGRILPGREAMDAAGIPVIRLAAKEGLALINGTQMMTAVGLLTLFDGANLAKLADIAAAMTGEALNAVLKAYDPKIQQVRGQLGQIDSAENLRRILRGSDNAKETNPDKVQDPYSLRCVPQVHGGTRDAIRHVTDLVAREINAVTDNPILFPEEDEVISGGNFHGQPMALAFDYLKIAIAELADISERRSERLINPYLSEGLPPFLTRHGGLCSGFMIAQYSAASMVSENKVYAHPASVDSIPSSGNQEDHVSMGTTAARTGAMILENTQRVLGIELFSASQAIWLRGESGLSPAIDAAYRHIRRQVDPVDEDILMHDALVLFEKMVRSNEIVEVVEQVTGELK